MKILHITPSTNGYEEVELLANRVNHKNHLSVIKCLRDDKDAIHMTGGIIIQDTPEIRAILDNIPKEKQYQIMYDLRMEPFVKPYYEE